MTITGEVVGHVVLGGDRSTSYMMSRAKARSCASAANRVPVFSREWRYRVAAVVIPAPKPRKVSRGR